MIENRSAPGGTIVPSLIYDDVGKAADWLCNVLGFRERLRAVGVDGKVNHAQLAIGQGGIFLGGSRTGQGFSQADEAQFRPPRPNEVSQTISVHIENVDQHYEHAKEHGAKILQTPVTHPYGERQYTVEDLEGHRWTFSQTVADIDPKEWGATVTDISSSVGRRPRPSFCYLEIPAVDILQSVSFYEKTFGWNIRHRNTDRPTFDDASGNISGAWVMRREASRIPGLLPYIWVDGIDAAVAQVKAQGGEVIEEPHLDKPGGEWIATFRDPAGNLMGLYQEGRR